MFEAFAMTLIECEMPVSNAAKILKVFSHRLWRIFNFWIGQARSGIDLSELQKIGVNETSSKRGHDYVTLAVDLDKRRVIFGCPGKDETTIEQLGNYLKNKGLEPHDITHFSIDMSPAFISGIQKQFPVSNIVYDRFHIKKQLNECMDVLRKLERKEHEILKGHKYTFLKKKQESVRKAKTSQV